ncbi:S-methyl-5'-thioadenosine phosphorylase-like [Diadema antillarum]|uniref:S-methyl-5'-thioadenosine phosphorylase-like n=1 Tax=Diadema antillarum TaxID=105358 RepID=UPI003A83F832
MTAIKVGIIGGSGLDDPDILQCRQEKFVETPYGKPSDALILGQIGGVDCVLLARHGRKHNIMPTNVNYRANIYALKQEGCTHLIVTTACGSLQEHIAPGHIVIPDQFIDRTHRRVQTFYDGSEDGPQGISHLAMHSPFCEKSRELLIASTESLGLKCHTTGTVVTIEGPRFSSRAESKMFRIFGGDIINMTTVPEVVLAKEQSLCYAAIALPTDYDSWRESEEPVSVEVVMKTFSINAANAKKILLDVIPKLAQADWEDTIKAHEATAKESIMGV